MTTETRLARLSTQMLKREYSPGVRNSRLT